MGWSWFLVVAAVLVAVDRFALTAEARDWLYWRRSDATSSSAAQRGRRSESTSTPAWRSFRARHGGPASADDGTVSVWDW